MSKEPNDVKERILPGQKVATNHYHCEMEVVRATPIANSVLSGYDGHVLYTGIIALLRDSGNFYEMHYVNGEPDFIKDALNRLSNNLSLIRPGDKLEFSYDTFPNGFNSHNYIMSLPDCKFIGHPNNIKNLTIANLAQKKR